MAYRLLPQLYPATETLHVMGRGSVPAFSGSFRVLVWNMYKAQRQGWAEDFTALAARSDLILLQEAVINTGFDSMFLNSEQFEWVMAKSHGSVKTNISTGVKTGSVVPSEARSFFLSPDSEPLLKTPKALLATTHKVEGSDAPLLVVNIHAINFVSYTKFSRQIEQMVQAVKAHAGPLLLAGDFNTWNAQRYKSLMEVTSAMELTPLELTRRAHLRHLGRHLDHIFYRGLKPLRAEVVQTLRSSDHDPLLADFSFL